MKRNRGGLLITGRRFLALPQRQLLRILNRGKAARVLYLERISCFLILNTARGAGTVFAVERGGDGEDGLER